MRPNRRLVTQSLSAVAASSVAGLGWTAQPTALTFVATGDFGQHGDHRQRQVAHAMGVTAEQIKSQFVVAVGDNFYDAGVTSVDDPHWKDSFENIYTAPSLQTPWYAILGNHDYGGEPQAQIDYAKTSNRWRMPARYYVQTVAAPRGQAVDMIFIDSPPFLNSYQKSKSHMGDNVRTQDLNAQMAWLETTLSNSKAPWKLVFSHHPVFSGGVHGDTHELIDRVKPLLEQHGVQAFINGHDHDLQHIERDGVTYVGTGAGADPRHVKSIDGTVFCSDHGGFTAYRLAGDTLTIDFIDDRGVLLHTAKVPRVRSGHASRAA